MRPRGCLPIPHLPISPDLSPALLIGKLREPAAPQQRAAAPCAGLAPPATNGRSSGGGGGGGGGGGSGGGGGGGGSGSGANGRAFVAPEHIRAANGAAADKFASFAQVPVVDFGAFYSDDAAGRATLAAQLFSAFKEIGRSSADLG